MKKCLLKLTICCNCIIFFLIFEEKILDLVGEFGIDLIYTTKKFLLRIPIELIIGIILITIMILACSNKIDFENILIGLFIIFIVVISYILNIEYIKEFFIENNLFCLNLSVFCITIIFYIKNFEEMIWKRKKEYLYSVIIIISIYFIYYQFTKDMKNAKFPIESLFNTLVAFLAITFLLEKINQIKTVNKRERLFWRYNHIYIRFNQINAVYIRIWNNIYINRDGTKYKNEIIELKKEVEFILSTFYSDIDNDEFTLIMQIRVNLDMIINKLENKRSIYRGECSYIRGLIYETTRNLTVLNKKWAKYQEYRKGYKAINETLKKTIKDEWVNSGLSIEEFAFRKEINYEDNSIKRRKLNFETKEFFEDVNKDEVQYRITISDNKKIYKVMN